MEYFDINSYSPNLHEVGRVGDVLRRGGVIVYPTDTHAALGCDALNPTSIARLCKIKGINTDKQTLSVVCGSLSQAAAYARIDNRAFAIMKANTPGPFTFILPASPALPKAFKGRKQVGVRIPEAPLAVLIAEELDRPIVSGSIGEADPADFAHCVDAIVTDTADDYSPADRQSSAIIDLTDSADPVIVREGPRPLI